MLVHAGAGGVGHIAIQLARHLGAHVATTVSGADKARFVESLGAERAIDYKSQDFVEQTLAWTNGKGADVVFDTVGGPAFCQSFGAVRSTAGSRRCCRRRARCRRSTRRGCATSSSATSR